ncbi:MAG: hypothetical protein QNK23_06345 [Crocinitomicaceae bacterium]|nr:hypothetical protein [Crocinitomicaceae bacterium]
MKGWCQHIIIALILLSSSSLFAQDEKSEIIQQRVEFISELLETEELDLTNIVEQLNYYYDHPLNLNSAEMEDLQDLSLLSEIQINDLLLHRKLFGKFISIYEIQGLEYWDMQTIRLVLPFVRVDDKLDQLHVGIKEAFKQGKFEAFLRYQRIAEHKTGYDNVDDSTLANSSKYYHGNPDRYYARFRFKYRTNLSIGITAEKDPGEEFFTGNRRDGFDFYSAHAFYKGGKYLRSVALGDYQIQIGQGLNLWSGYAFGKSADATNIKKTANSLKPYTSVDEARFLRGAAVQLGIKRFSFTAFASYKQVDGALSSVVDSLQNSELLVESINYNGLHRTNSEIAKRHTLNETMFGGNLQYKSRALQLGVAAVYQGYDQIFAKDTFAYNQFDFRGRSTIGISADYSWVFRNFNFFGEVSTSTHSGGFANIHGVLFSLDRRASMSLAYRNYSRNYETFYNNGLAEGSETQNESGLYAGLKLNLTKSFTVNAYIDVFKFPWMKYQVDGPSKGHEFLVQPMYRPSRKLEIYGRFREQHKQRNSRITIGGITPLEAVIQRNYRLNISYQVSESIKLKSRIEYVTINRASGGKEEGFILTQDLIFRPKSFPIDIALRYALFDTDSYDTRIYTYENNALYVFSSPSYYYQGSRAYVLVRWTFLKRFDLWARYGVSIFSNRESLGTGGEEIRGGTKTDLTLQLRIKF